MLHFSVEKRPTGQRAYAQLTDLLAAQCTECSHLSAATNTCSRNWNVAAEAASLSCICTSPYDHLCVVGVTKRVPLLLISRRKSSLSLRTLPLQEWTRRKPLLNVLGRTQRSRRRVLRERPNGRLSRIVSRETGQAECSFSSKTRAERGQLSYRACHSHLPFLVKEKPLCLLILPTCRIPALFNAHQRQSLPTLLPQQPAPLSPGHSSKQPRRR